MTDPLKRMGKRVAGDPFFLASVLASYAHSEAIDDGALATRLACPEETLTLLRLCRNPEPAPPNFWKDVTVIAERFAVDADRLAEIVRLGQAVWKLEHSQTSGDSDKGFLMAARDGDTLPPEEPG